MPILNKLLILPAMQICRFESCYTFKNVSTNLKLTLTQADKDKLANQIAPKSLLYNFTKLTQIIARSDEKFNRQKRTIPE